MAAINRQPVFTLHVMDSGHAVRATDSMLGRVGYGNVCACCRSHVHSNVSYILLQFLRLATVCVITYFFWIFFYLLKLNNLSV